MSFDGDNSEDIEVFLNKAVEGSCEGLMVKTLNDFYQPAKRSLNWLKLKKDYMDGMADSLDLGKWAIKIELCHYRLFRKLGWAFADSKST